MRENVRNVDSRLSIIKVVALLRPAAIVRHAPDMPVHADITIYLFFLYFYSFIIAQLLRIFKYYLLFWIYGSIMRDLLMNQPTCKYSLTGIYMQIYVCV